MGRGISAQNTRGNTDSLDCVKAQLSFIPRTTDEGPTFAASQNLGGVGMVKHEVKIYNARPVASSLSLDRQGFALIKHKSAYANELTSEPMRAKYLEEMAQFIKVHFDASAVVAYQHGAIPSVIVRSSDGSRGIATGVVAHVDFTSTSAPAVAEISCLEKGVQSRAYSRLMLIQTWRALSPPPQDSALGLCDGSSISDDDLVATPYSRDGSAAELWLLRHNPHQRWYYFPEMEQDEVILFKGYDSNRECDPRSAHSGFDNRLAFPNAEPRVSVETRFFVYFD